MKVGEAIIKTLEDIGVDTVFGGSGQSTADLLIPLSESDKIKTVIIRNEQAASFMACGYATFSQKLGVCFATTGPGSFNLISGLSVAYTDSLPMLAISGYATKDTFGKGDLGDSTGIGRTPNGPAIFEAITKGAFIIEKPEDTCDVMQEALTLAFEGRPGPVHLYLPYDVAAEDIPNYRTIDLKIEEVLPLENQTQIFADVLSEALIKNKKIMMLLGYGCIRSEAETDLLKFIERYNIPFATTMDGKGMIPENHRLSVGTIGVSGDEGANQYFDDSEVVFALGNAFAKWSTFKFKDTLFDDKILMHVNIDRHEIGKVYPAQYSIAADVKATITGIAKKMDPEAAGLGTDRIKRDKYFDLNIDYSGEAVHPGQLCQEISKHLPKDSIILGDAGAHMLWLNAYLSLDDGQYYQNPGEFGPMACNVNGSIGYQCANPNKRVIAAVGDGDYQMAGFELMTAVENKIPVVWIIFNNGEFNIIKTFQMLTKNTDVFNQFFNPDFVKYAEACGTKGYRVEKIEDFGDVFEKALALNEPVIIDVKIDPDIEPPFKMRLKK